MLSLIKRKLNLNIHLPKRLRNPDLPIVKPEQLDHLIHALRMSGGLKRLTAKQIDNIAYAMKVAGLKSQYFTGIMNEANYDDGQLISYFNCDFLKDPLFTEAYALGQATNSYPGSDIRWRVYVVCWAAYHARQLEGDFVECGVNRGGFARSVIHYIDFQKIKEKAFYLLDTFCGFPEEDLPLISVQHNFTECFEAVKETFKEFDNVKLIRGKVPNTLTEVPSKKICFLSIDMNHAVPEIAAAEYFWDKLVSGGVIVLDDYGCGDSYLPQKAAFDRFAMDRGVSVLSLPTCQGLIFKP